MTKTLIIGFLLGIVGTIAGSYYIPVVDQYREASVISVTPNGGNVETFHINVPIDRILVGAPDQATPVPPGLKWPSDVPLEGIRAELYKIRNSRDTVVGVASRVTAKNQSFGDSIEWVLHLPARGSIYASMPPDSIAGSSRVGTMHAGTREFEALRGQLSERWVANTDEADEDAPLGRIELETKLVGESGDGSDATAGTGQETEGAL